MGRLPRHVTEARRERLRAMLESSAYLPVGAVCAELGVSEATARRDLASLEGRKLVRRTHGGALSPYAGALGDFERLFPTFDQRRGVCEGAKRVIAERAAGLVRAGSTVFVDAGTTCFALGEAMAARFAAGASEVSGGAIGITVVTNNLAVAVRLARVEGIRVEVLGGTLLPRQAALFGDETCRGVSGRRIDLAFLGGEGFDGQGVWNSQQDVVRLQRAVIAASGRTVLLLDGTKFRRRAPVLLTAWSGTELLVTDCRLTRLRRAGVGVDVLSSEFRAEKRKR